MISLQYIEKRVFGIMYLKKIKSYFSTYFFMLLEHITSLIHQYYDLAHEFFPVLHEGEQED